ncbi:MAG: methyl-accepting chemotaxis protein [Candidatus Binatia bacterium]|nr:MAG: methyl-accepting chemotaxis protein [Candidatus Binatia bacterium]
MLARLTIPQKFVLMGAVFGVALAAVTYRMVVGMRALGSDFARKEILGLDYQVPLVHLLRDLQSHRGLAVAALQGEGEFAGERQAAAARVQERLRAVDEVDGRIGELLGVHAKWTKLRAEIEGLLQHWQEHGRELFEKHSAIHAQLLSLLARVGDASNLSFDPNPVSYYLSDSTRVAAPELAEVMAQVRDLALQIAVQGGAIREEELKAFSRRYAVVYYYVDRLQADLERVYEAEPALRDRVESKRAQLATAGQNFLAALDREFLNVEYAKIMPADWWSVSTQAIEAAYGFHDAATPVLREVLEARVSALSRQLMLTIALLVLGGLAVAALAVAIIRDLDRPLQEAVRAAEQLATGDLTVRLSANGRRDEVGALANAFERMVVSLRDVASAADRISRGDLAVSIRPQSESDVLGQALSRMVNTLQEQIGLLLEGIQRLGATNRSVTDALQRVMTEAQRAVHAAEQAGKRVEEVKETAEAASQRASEVAAAGEQAVAISEIGEKAVHDAIAGIENVREQMKVIVKKIAHLGEQTRAIAQITATVNDLADQSDLLSVNAGIEAVRAGVHGKGFAVVAQEVKNLSDRSKRATAQITSILADIQKAAQDVILASEQATKAAEAGIQQTLDSGEAIRTLTQSLVEATAAVAAITQTSQRQLVDVEQVAAAMQLIDEASRANLESVRQIEESIQNLTQVSRSLENLVNRYNVAL